MKLVVLHLPSLWWLVPIALAMGLMVWQRRRLKMTPLRAVAILFLLIALLNPSMTLEPESTDSSAFNLQIVKPRVLLVEYGGGKTFLGTVLGNDSPANTDVISPDDLPMVSDSLRKYDVIALHTSKNMQVFTDYLSDWHSFPNRTKLESVFSDYGVVFENGTQSLPQDLESYGLIVLATADVKAQDADRLTEYVEKGGRVLVLLHAGGGLAINPPGVKNPYCILYHHPPYGDRPFPEEWLQRNTATWLTKRMGLKAIENISCTYGKMVVQKSSLSVLQDIYGDGGLYPDEKIEGKDFNKLDWTTAFVDYDPAWQSLLKIDYRYTSEPTGHDTPIQVNINGKTVAIAREYGKGKVFVFGYAPINYGMLGVPPTMILAAAPYVGSELTYDQRTYQALANYVTNGGNLVVVGASVPKSSGALKMTDLLPVNISGPQISETTKVVFRNSAHPVLNGLTPFMVSHYRVTGLKANGEALAADGKNNPVLATAYYGLGKVVYYLPEIPAWATVENTAPADFWRRLVSWLSPADTGVPGRDTNLAVRASDKLPLSIQITDDRGKPVTKAAVSCEYYAAGGIPDTAELKESPSGVYTGQVSLETPGDYTLTYTVRAATVLKTAPVSLKVVPPGRGGLDRVLWKGVAFMNGYRSAPPVLMELPLWQLLVALGVVLLSVDWAWRILRGGF